MRAAVCFCLPAQRRRAPPPRPAPCPLPVILGLAPLRLSFCSAARLWLDRLTCPWLGAVIPSVLTEAETDAVRAHVDQYAHALDTLPPEHQAPMAGPGEFLINTHVTAS